MTTNTRQSGDGSSVHQLHQLCSRCHQPILSGGTSYEYEKAAGIHWACLRKETKEDVTESIAHELWLEAFAILFTGYPQERRLTLNLFKEFMSNCSIPRYLECLDRALDLARLCPYGNGPVLVQKISEIILAIDGMASSSETKAPTSAQR